MPTIQDLQQKWQYDTSLYATDLREIIDLLSGGNLFDFPADGTPITLPFTFRGQPVYLRTFTVAINVNTYQGFPTDTMNPTFRTQLFTGVKRIIGSGGQIPTKVYPSPNTTPVTPQMDGNNSIPLGHTISGPWSGGGAYNFVITSFLSKEGVADKQPDSTGNIWLNIIYKVDNNADANVNISGTATGYIVHT